MLDKFAQELRETREAQNISLKEMAEATRIDMKFLEAIDKGNFAFLPDLYVKAFIKNYAKQVGLNPEVTIKKFEAAKAGKSFDLPKQESEPAVVKQEEVHTRPRPPKPPIQMSRPPEQKETRSADQNRIIAIAAIVGIIVIGVILWFLLKGDSDDIVVEKPIEQIIDERKPRFEDSEPQQQNPLAFNSDEITSSDSLYLTISASDTAWVRIYSDDSRSDEFLLFPNSQKRVIARNNFKITFGNSKGIQLRLNNQPLNFTSRGMNVSHVEIDRNGLRYLNNPPGN
jgi:transcriptional regulator with XRE-family HTH domain